jgi:hypothetical protein
LRQIAAAITRNEPHGLPLFAGARRRKGNDKSVRIERWLWPREGRRYLLSVWQRRWMSHVAVMPTSIFR